MVEALVRMLALFLFTALFSLEAAWRFPFFRCLYFGVEVWQSDSRMCNGSEDDLRTPAREESVGTKSLCSFGFRTRFKMCFIG